MRIWLLTVGEPLPFDQGNPRLLRCGALAEFLSRKGHEVVWWTSTFDHYHKIHRHPHDADVLHNGYLIRMLHASGYSRNLDPRRLLEHEGVAHRFKKLSRSAPRPDVILCSFPTIELAREAVRYGERHDVPVLLDIRDLWPDLFLDLFPASLSWIGRAGLWWLFSQSRFALTHATGIIGISDQYLNWGLARAGRARRSSDRVSPLGYEPIRVSEIELTEAGRHLQESGVDPTKCICWFVGSFSRQFDFATVIRAAEALETRPDIQFVFSGKGDSLADARRRSKRLGNVVFTGWLGKTEIAWLSRHARIGLQPYARGVRVGLANKLFEYLAAGIPIVSSLQGENAEFLRRYDCGITYEPGDHGALRSHLVRLTDNPGLGSEMGSRGRDVFAREFSMESILTRLAEHLDGVIRSASLHRPLLVGTGQ